jgi:pyruvate dehydrogenase E2 component (dihydrolipoyllysine-residue acetyltransferase)
MATDVIMPALGVAQQKGTLLKWFKAEGHSVSKGEPLMEIETDKATVEIEAPASGILAQVSAAAGDEVPVGQTIALILVPGEPSPKPARPRVAAAPIKAPEDLSQHKSVTRDQIVTVPGRIAASPAARRIAKEKSIDLTSLKGSGPQGAIIAQDLLQVETTEPTQHHEGPKLKETVPLNPMRRIVGERMSRSKQTAPHFYISMDIDMTEVSRHRSSEKEKGVALVPSINDFILHATAQTLRGFPLLNAAFTGRGIDIYSDINLGMAVALEEGLVVPVLRNADRLSLGELSIQSRELAEKAQKKKLFPLDYEGGTFTVSNLGMLGVDSFVAIINPPQSAILAVGRVAPRVVSDDGMFAIKSVMTVTLSADHRVVDGAIAARFLRKVKQLLEQPEV